MRRAHSEANLLHTVCVHGMKRDTILFSFLLYNKEYVASLIGLYKFNRLI